jgi:uncharacterized protein (DUF983 family)
MAFQDYCVGNERSRIRAMAQAVSLPRALQRGFMMRCPQCGRGHLFARFLKVRDRCEVCGEDFTPQRADDFPAYIVIVIIGHIVVAGLLEMDAAFSPPAWLEFLIWLPATLFGALALLQPVKGAIVALQWQTGMHGFGGSRHGPGGGASRAISAPAAGNRN